MQIAWVAFVMLKIEDVYAVRMYAFEVLRKIVVVESGG